MTGAAPSADEGRWHERLAPDYRRAAYDIYRSMMGDGATTIREWVSQNYSGTRGPGAHLWIDLWTTATNLDYRLGEAKQAFGHQGLLQALHSDDTVEISFRRLASYVYEHRTGDTTGANSMLAVCPPGTKRDIAPAWLVESASIYTKNEQKRAEAVRAHRKGDGKKGDGDRKGDTKGKRGDGKGGAKAGAGEGK